MAERAATPPRRLRPGLAALALAVAACASDPPSPNFSFVATSPEVASRRVLRVLRAGARGEACFNRNVVRAILTPPWMAQRADHGRAIADALSQVEGSNVLLDAVLRVEVRQYLLFSRVCAVVTGDAGVIQ